jgi:hypothetical protein
MQRRSTFNAHAALAAILAGGVLAAGSVSAAGDSCREWSAEHRQWKLEVLRCSLGGAAQSDLDAAVFEMLQREAYLTSCDLSTEGARDELVGWRLVDRLPDDYPSAVLESVLVRGGFDLDLRPLFEDALARSVAASGAARPAPGARSRRHGSH